MDLDELRLEALKAAISHAARSAVASFFMPSMA
jgi:hypothetical protein